MKILYATRLFSGLETSFESGIWAPTGVPTIYKIIDELDKKHETRFIFSAKDNGDGYFSTWVKKNDYISTIAGLDQSVRVLSGINFFPKWIARKLAMFLREIRQMFVIILEILRFKPDVIYCDHANIILAAILARCQHCIPVVFRAMGVYPFMRQTLTPVSMIHRIYRWAYKSPFSLVICTQDGSGVELWLDNALGVGVKSKVLLNGVDKITITSILDKKLQLISKKHNIILFVGKLEKYKGCYEFIESVLLLLKRKNTKVHALVIGIGSEQKQLMKLVEKAERIDNFTFIDRLSHDQILAAHELSDIYVSMNHLGNLSNANLEAIQSDDCMVIPRPQPDIGVDVETNNLLLGAVVNVPINNPKKLSDSLYDLIHHKEKRLIMSKEISIKKQSFLWSWDERISAEMSLLENLVLGSVE